MEPLKIWAKNLEIMETKKEIRKRLLAERNALPENKVTELSEKICLNLQKYLKNQTDLKTCGVYGYYPYGKEGSLINLYQWLLEQRIPLAFPRVLGDTMEFYQINSLMDFNEGAFHIMEPKRGCPQASFEAAYCLVPGSAFGENGNRYGYGKGYYDKYFSLHKGLKRLGIAYEMQMQKEIPSEDTDIKMQMIVTETQIRQVSFTETEH